MEQQLAFESKENSKLLHFGLYFLYFYSIICNAQEKRSDNLFYDNLPIVYNFEEECQPQSKNIKLNNCPSLAWLVKENLRLRLHIHGKLVNIAIEDCFHKCLNTPQCIAILRINHDCYTYDKGHTSNFDKSYTTYLLTCCTPKTKSIDKLQNVPVLFSNKIIEGCKTDNKINACTSITNKVFILWESKTFVGYKVFKNKNSHECMHECIIDEKCVSFSVHVNYNFLSECHLNKNSTWISSSVQDKNNHANIYQLTCCSVNYPQMFTTNKNANLMMVYQLGKFCIENKNKNARSCQKQIWQVEENVRMKSPYKIYDMLNLEKCLNNCLENMECYSVSVDLIYKRCLFFHENQNDKFYGQVAFTSYYLKCCD